MSDLELSASHKFAYLTLTNTPGGGYWAAQFADEKTGSERSRHPFRVTL